jgi:hypothetical protein
MRLITVIAIIIGAAVACAPEPTTPSSTNLGGVWTSNAHLYDFSGFRLVVSSEQDANGLFKGSWTGNRDVGTGCSVAKPCGTNGTILGRNTVSRIEMEILGAGKFDGVLVEPNRLRGLFAVGSDYDTITFDRVPDVTATRIPEVSR